MTGPFPKHSLERHEQVKLVAKLERDLAGVRRISPTRRDAELAEVREDTILAMLRDLGVDSEGR